MINKSFFYNNTPSNVIVIVAFNVSYRLLLEAADTVRCYRPLIQSDVTGRCFFMDELKNLANVVIGKFREIGIAMMSPVAMLFH
jgi:hypothetical protein